MESGKNQLLFLIIVSLASAAESWTHCEKEWVQFGKNCYNFSSSATTFKDAMIFCNNLGAELLELQRKAEEDWIDLQCRVRGYAFGVWLGLSDLQNEGQFVTLSDAHRPRYSNWIKGEPNNLRENEHCAMYWSLKKAGMILRVQ